jgi:hypothetical protein
MTEKRQNQGKSKNYFLRQKRDNAPIKREMQKMCKNFFKKSRFQCLIDRGINSGTPMNLEN